MKTIIVSGCSRGIGREMVKAFFAMDGMKIIGISRNKTALKSLQNELERDAGDLLSEFIPVAADIAQSEPRKKLLKHLAQLGLEVDILINNAGYLKAAAFENSTEAEFDRMFSVNIKAPYFLIQGFLPMMQKGAHIVNISSMGGVQGSVKFPGLAAYSSSKGALSILTEALAEELKAREISVNALALGAVKTEMLQEAFPGYEPPLNAQEMGIWIADFCINGRKFFNGKLLPVSSTTP